MWFYRQLYPPVSKSLNPTGKLDQIMALEQQTNGEWASHAECYSEGLRVAHGRDKSKIADFCMKLEQQVRKDALLINNSGVLARVFGNTSTLPKEEMYARTIELLHSPEFLKENPFIYKERIVTALGRMECRKVYSSHFEAGKRYITCHFVNELDLN